MFRCVTELKGLVIDIDSFKEISVEDWKDIFEKFKCLYLTSDENMANVLREKFGSHVVFEIEKFRKWLAPNSGTHQTALRMLELKTTEIAYVSEDIHFLSNAMGFLCGAIWVTDRIDYKNASIAPDLICRSFATMKDVLMKNIKGFLGEVAIFPEEVAHGMIIPVEFPVNEDVVPLYMLGRYFGYSHYMNQLHPYSSSIFLNKKEGKAFGKFNETFEGLYTVAVKRIQKSNEVYGVCSVPARPGKHNRFETIVARIASECGILNLSDKMICSKDYPSQKKLSQMEREENVEGVFDYNGDLNGKNVVIIDDIISTGSTMRACIKELKNKGANQIFVVVLAINQREGNYWSSVEAQVSCPVCGDKMHLLLNSQKNVFFYTCYNCRNSTLDFDEGRTMLCEQVNNEFE